MSAKQKLFGLGAILLLGAIALAAWIIRERQRSSVSSCIVHLKSLEGAKATWALEYKKTMADAPAWADLFGPTRYTRDKPVCPQGGSYTLGSIAEPATCTFPGHTL
jgi:hypothetical protein